MTYNGGGTITSVPPAVFTETGTIFQAPESPPNLSIPSRSFRLDVTDGDFSMISQQEDGIYYISTPINNLGDTWRVSKLRLFLRVGATGTIKTTVYKLTESDNSAATPPNNSPYIPASTFPSP
jgi:hypothetical protein